MGKGLQIIILLIVVIIGILYPLFVDSVKNTGNKTEDSFVEGTYDFFAVTFRSFLGIPIFIIGLIVILSIPSEEIKQPMKTLPPYQPIPPPKSQYY
tara:strand:- start:333 stop:620 length:288 start_codon:yes stop_codon:yes gene_type:complete